MRWVCTDARRNNVRRGSVNRVRAGACPAVSRIGWAQAMINPMLAQSLGPGSCGTAAGSSLSAANEPLLHRPGWERCHPSLAGRVSDRAQGLARRVRSRQGRHWGVKRSPVPRKKRDAGGTHSRSIFARTTCECGVVVSHALYSAAMPRKVHSVDQLDDCPVCQATGRVESRLPFRTKVCEACGGRARITAERRQALLKRMAKERA
jgi:hypothetical protein